MSQREEEYAKLYKDTHDRKYKDMAIKEMENLIYMTVSGYNRAQSLDNRVLFNKGIGLALAAIDTWDPEQSRLATHVVNSLRPLQRDVYKYGPILHIPEHRIKDWKSFQGTITEYEAEHGSINYDPKVLSEMSGFPINQVKTMLKENTKVYNTSTDSTTNISWQRMDYRFSLDLLETEFRKDPEKYKVWREIKKTLEEGGKPNAAAISRTLDMNYTVCNKLYTDIAKQISDIVMKARTKY